VKDVKKIISNDHINFWLFLGWGATSVNESRTNHLRDLDVNVTSSSDCEQIFQKFIPNFNLATTKICAAGSPGTDGCKGYSL